MFIGFQLTQCLLALCLGNCHWTQYVLCGSPGTIWMGIGSPGGLQEEGVTLTFDTWCSLLSVSKDNLGSSPLCSTTKKEEHSREN